MSFGKSVLHSPLSPQLYPQISPLSAAYRQYSEIMTANESPIYLYADGEQHGSPSPHGDLGNGLLPLGLLWQTTYRPDHYHHGGPAAANRSSPIQHNATLSYMDDAPLRAVAEFPDYSSMDLQESLEGGSSSFTKGPSPPSLLNPSSDDVAVLWPMAASPELSSFAYEEVSRPHLS